MKSGILTKNAPQIDGSGYLSSDKTSFITRLEARPFLLFMHGVMKMQPC